MKRLTISMVAAAIVVLAAGSASAQTLKAEIPFAFRVGNAMMAPGSYQVQLSATGHEHFLVFRNSDTRASAAAQFQAGDVPKAWKARGTATIAFECSGARCSLLNMWTGSGNTMGYDFHSPAHRPGGETRMTEIRMSVVKAD